MPETKQPKWRFLENLGDVNPLISAALVYLDMTGVYEPEMVCFHEDNMKNGKYLVYRVVLERCSMRENNHNTLSDNRFHADRPAWFAQDIAQVAEMFGEDVRLLAKRLVSNDPLERAEGYRMLLGYHGEVNFDGEPCEMTRAEIRKRYRAAFPRRKRSATINDKRQLVLDTGI